MSASHVEGLKEIALQTEEVLLRLIPTAPGARGRVLEAMRYACVGGGKRLRPFLTVASADLFEVPRAQSMRAGAALEMVHCYSLVHDDLPAMDDADTRRGRPSVHKTFDDATAILAGDGLLTFAFEVMAHPDTHADASVRAELVTRLASASGEAGMVGGQMIDLAAERDGLPLDLDGITELQALKTGALIRFGCEAGGILGQASEDERRSLIAYAEDIGLAFQIVDDLLDVFGSEEEIGKPVGQDAAVEKPTFVRLLGADGARARADALIDQAVARLDGFGAPAEPLKQVARFVGDRRS